MYKRSRGFQSILPELFAPQMEGPGLLTGWLSSRNHPEAEK
jgi:hypothetical protein